MFKVKATMSKTRVQPNPAPQPIQSSSKILSNVGNIVRKARVEKSWSQAKLANEVVVTPSFITQLETGKVYPSYETALLLVNKLGLDQEQFLLLLEKEKKEKTLQRLEARATSRIPTVQNNNATPEKLLNQHPLDIFTARRKLAEIGIPNDFTQKQVIIELTERIFGLK